ncbi:DUF2948 family protein [Phyllobacterium endophyticum]|uniref:DUF2948 domain-containing protein n=1 Tax=Phyllobacterium endophyticum TaxID=1149773 RepID=A0A2P7B105_9HYPH|nr:DUF2948 family protein [Phyllobacterium endophyticum]MBB3237626.1 hypothetical protein [Phyllobacterium endophyticum]PSH60094.1 DUF2948 domain-containing protein [Phyllobacterium endophyticum]TXR48349.1 DUF2948 family protein [Phyllobacterium endophyticum]TYR42261.1 DUF2948 family protein [Phyllobacterium endophyticum]
MENLKLIALDEEDLRILSAHLQDSLLKVGDIDYLAAEKKLVVGVNRFVWELAADGKRHRSFVRRRTALLFDRVNSVKAAGIDRQHKEDILSLLAIRFIPGEAPSGIVELTFSAGKALRLEVEAIEAQLTDLGPAWETTSKPEHDD